MNELEKQRIQFIIEHPRHYDRLSIEVLLNQLHRAKEILGSHHADLAPSEQKFWSELESLFT